MHPVADERAFMQEWVTMVHLQMAYRGPWFDGLLEGTVCALVRCPSKDGRPSSCLSLTMDTDVAISSLHLHAQFPVGDPLGTVLPIVGTQEGVERGQ